MKINLILRFHRKFWKFNRLIISLFIFLKNTLFKPKKGKDQKIAYFERKDWVYFQRYIYILTKYFLNEGYQVYFPNNFKQIYHFSTTSDCNFLLKEKDVFFRKPTKGVLTNIHLNIDNISPDYFESIRSGYLNPTSYTIPIGFHPFHYFKSYIPGEIDLEAKRINKVFFAGNFKADSYSLPFLSKYFKINNRMELFSFLIKKNLVTVPQNQQELTSILDEKYSGIKQIIIAKGKSNGSISPAELKDVTKRFDFFFAFPGMYMPLCHNIIEAMSVGTIPIIQVGYSKILNPPLINLNNCITFFGTDDLEEAIDFCLNLPIEEVTRIRKNVIIYFNENLSSKSIVQKMESGKYDKFLLMAEQNSVAILEACHF